MTTLETRHMTAGAEAIDYDYHNPFKDFNDKVRPTTISELAIKGQLVRFLIDMNDVCVVHFTNKGMDIKDIQEQLRIKGVLSEAGLEVLSRISISVRKHIKTK